MWHPNKSHLINCSIVICSVGNLFKRVIDQLHSVHLFFVQLLIYSIDFCLVSFLFKSFVQLALFKTTSINWQGRNWIKCSKSKVSLHSILEIKLKGTLTFEGQEEMFDLCATWLSDGIKVDGASQGWANERELSWVNSGWAFCFWTHWLCMGWSAR